MRGGKRLLRPRGSDRNAVDGAEHQPYRAGWQSSFYWECSAVLTKVAAIVVVLAALVLLANSELRLGQRLASVLPRAVVRYFTTETPVMDPAVIRDFEAKVDRELSRQGAKSPGKGAAAEPVSFGMGSTKKEVRAAQGSPAFAGENLWRYGASEVYFVAGRVVGWRTSPDTPLRLR